MRKDEILIDMLRQGKGSQINNVYKAIYGYELTYPGYAEKALSAMEQAG